MDLNFTLMCKMLNLIPEYFLRFSWRKPLTPPANPAFWCISRRRSWGPWRTNSCEAACNRSGKDYPRPACRASLAAFHVSGAHLLSKLHLYDWNQTPRWRPRMEAIGWKDFSDFSLDRDPDRFVTSCSLSPSTRRILLCISPTSSPNGRGRSRCTFQSHHQRWD